MLSKRLINSNDAAAGGACTTNTNDYPTTNVAYYKMSTAADEKDTYNGTASNVNFNVQGKFGNAGEFNGSSSVMTIPTSTINVGSPYTFSMWLNFTDVTAYKGIFANITSSRLTNEISVLLNNGKITIYSVNSNGNTNLDAITATPQTSIVNNTWTNVVVIADRSATNKAKVFFNGVEAASYVYQASAASTAAYSNTQIGLADGQYLDGKLDQVRIFSSALDATQVASLYNEVYCVPTIVPTDNFEPVIYTGNGGTKQITTLDFQPDFTWIKNRNNSASSTHAHALFDSVRTSGFRLVSNTSAAENDYSAYMTGFNSGGFNLSGNPLNDSAGTYVSWNWKAGGDDVLNEEGSIDSQVSANVDAGFSIVTYGGSTSGATIGHGLNSTPEVIIIKCTSTGSTNWISYHQPLGDDYYLTLNSTLAKANYNNWLQPNSTTFALNQTFGNANTSGRDYVAYCFHSVDGYSKIGSYKGTGATGNTIVTGFRPAFVMIKASSASSSWYMFDNKRLTSPYSDQLIANSSAAEVTGTYVVLNSNGFTLNTTASDLNNSGVTFIFMAFAEEALPYVTRNATNPFGDSSELALYKFEDDATDAEGNYDATSSPNVTYASGYIDKAAVFNGSSSYINISSLPELTANRSVSMWFKASSIDNNDRLFGSVQGSNYFNISFGATNNISAYTGGTLISSASNSISTNVWHNVVLVANGTSGKLYIDGNEVISTTITSHTINPTAAYIGTNEGNVGVQVPNASIDQVRIFNRALDSGEVTALYNE